MMLLWPPIYQRATLYVGDLHPDVTEADLLQKFSPIGSLSSIRICRDIKSKKSLGYAYVNYIRPEDAERALKKLNFDLIKNRPIRIMWSQRDPSLRLSGVGNVFVKNLDKTIEPKELLNEFSKYGKILSCKIAQDMKGNSKGYGFVQFETENIAQKCIENENGKILKNKAIYVGKFIPSKELKAMKEKEKLVESFVMSVRAALAQPVESQEQPQTPKQADVKPQREKRSQNKKKKTK